jgi:chemotaxis protein MotB
MAQNDRPIIIKRIVKHDHDDEHGGAWKVAYADFMTAMMAFFLLLWLLSDTTDQKLEGVADYFTPTEVSLTSYGSADILSGETLPEVKKDLASDAEKEAVDPDIEEIEVSKVETVEGSLNPWATLASNTEDTDTGSAELDAIKDDLLQLISEDGPLAHLSENLLFREENGRLLIEILDAGSTPLFDKGRSSLTEASILILHELSGVLRDLPQNMTITGHTDATPYGGSTNYTNWELSSDRANSTRRALQDFGIGTQRIDRVSGMAAQQPIVTNNPFDGKNRRVTIELISDLRSTTNPGPR